MTSRKRLILDVLDKHWANRPVLLSELRYVVHRFELALAGEAAREISRSERSSFNETIRRMGEFINRYKLSPMNQLPIGLLAREALFRVQSRQLEESLLKGQDLVVAIRWSPLLTAGGTSKFPEISFWKGNPNEGSSLKFLGRVALNTGQRLTVVSKAPLTKSLIREQMIIHLQVAIVQTWARHQFDHPKNTVDQLIAQHGDHRWIPDPPFPEIKGHYYLFPLGDGAADYPLLGSQHIANETVKDWDALFHLDPVYP